MPKNNKKDAEIKVSKRFLLDDISEITKNITEFILKGLEQTGKGLESLGNQSEIFNNHRK